MSQSSDHSLPSTDPVANEDHVKPLPLDDEADEVLKRIMDEVRHEASHPTDDTSELDQGDVYEGNELRSPEP